MHFLFCQDIFRPDENGISTFIDAIRHILFEKNKKKNFFFNLFRNRFRCTLNNVVAGFLKKTYKKNQQLTLE